MKYNIKIISENYVFVWNIFFHFKIILIRILYLQNTPNIVHTKLENNGPCIFIIEFFLLTDEAYQYPEYLCFLPYLSRVWVLLVAEESSHISFTLISKFFRQSLSILAQCILPHLHTCFSLQLN